MTALVEGARRLVGRGASDVDAMMDGLAQAVSAARGRLDDNLVDDAAAVLDRAGTRLRLSAEHTVVALAGATGSGKSSAFNAIAGLPLAAVGVRRPTTASTTACVWGAEGAGELLDWLGVPQRHQVERTSLLDQPTRAAEGTDACDFEGLVLLDLPDHDSTEVSHHLEVDRLVALADLLVWVLDPQKYADAAVHERYLAPLASHAEVILVVLNQIDTVAPRRRQDMVHDLYRLLRREGLDDVPVIATSLRDGDGVENLKRAIASRVAQKKAARARLRADVGAVATRMQSVSGDSQPDDLPRRHEQELVDSFADAAGVPIVVQAVRRSTKARARQATGWPLTAWMSKLRPDPLKRLHLARGPGGGELASVSRTSLPSTSPVQRARVDTAVRAAANAVSRQLSDPWSRAVRRSSVARLPDLNDALDEAVATTELGVERSPAWWRVVRVLQVVVTSVALVGALWLGLLAAFGYLQVPVPATPEYRGFPMPTIALVGGLLAGLVLSLLSRAVAGIRARAKARAADRRLRAAIAEVTQRLVIQPMEAEMEAYRATRAGLAAAVG